jgi:hypothetical protein
MPQLAFYRRIPADVLSCLEPAEWRIVRDEERTPNTSGADGGRTLRDVVVRAARG